MTTKLLLPSKYKTIGWVILIPAAIMGIVISFTGYEANWFSAKVLSIFNDPIFGKKEYFSFVQTDITNTVVGILFILGGLLVSFSKEKNEDEYISRLRLSSLLWAVAVSYLLLLFAFAFVYGTAFLNVMIYNMFTVLIIFIIRFNYILYKNTKTVSDEK